MGMSLFSNLGSGTFATTQNQSNSGNTKRQFYNPQYLDSRYAAMNDALMQNQAEMNLLFGGPSYGWTAGQYTPYRSPFAIYRPPSSGGGGGGAGGPSQIPTGTAPPRPPYTGGTGTGAIHNAVDDTNTTYQGWDGTMGVAPARVTGGPPPQQGPGGPGGSHVGPGGTGGGSGAGTGIPQPYPTTGGGTGDGTGGTTPSHGYSNIRQSGGGLEGGDTSDTGAGNPDAGNTTPSLFQRPGGIGGSGAAGNYPYADNPASLTPGPGGVPTQYDPYGNPVTPSGPVGPGSPGWQTPGSTPAPSTPGDRGSIYYNPGQNWSYTPGQQTGAPTGGVYGFLNDLLNSSGYSDAEKQAITAEAANSTRAGFQNQADALARHSAITGNPVGFYAAQAQMGRDQTGQLAEQARQNQIAFANEQERRRELGGAGMEGLYGQLEAQNLALQNQANTLGMLSSGDTTSGNQMGTSGTIWNTSQTPGLLGGNSPLGDALGKAIQSLLGGGKGGGSVGSGGGGPGGGGLGGGSTGKRLPTPQEWQAFVDANPGWTGVPLPTPEEWQAYVDNGTIDPGQVEISTNTGGTGDPWALFQQGYDPTDFGWPTDWWSGWGGDTGGDWSYDPSVYAPGGDT